MEFKEVKLTPTTADSISRSTVDKLQKRIEAQKILNQSSVTEENPFNFTYPSLYSNEILKNKETYILNFDGTTLESGGGNVLPVVHFFGMEIETITWIRNKVIPKLPGANVGGYGDWLSYLAGSTVTLNDEDVFGSLLSYSNAGSITGYFSINAGVDNPIVSAFSVELKGASGAVIKNIATYFESYDMNLRTQHLKDPQTISKDRGVVIITQPAAMSINFRPLK